MLRVLREHRAVASLIDKAEMIDVGHLPLSLRTAGDTLLPQRERRRQIADDLYDALVSGGYAFWDHIHPIFLSRDVTRHDIRELVVRPTSAVLRLATSDMSPADAGRSLDVDAVSRSAAR